MAANSEAEEGGLYSDIATDHCENRSVGLGARGSVRVRLALVEGLTRLSFTHI